MKKICLFILSVLLTVCLLGCTESTVVLDEAKTYNVTSEIHSLDIRLNAADFTIQQAEAFSVESNLKYLSVSEKNGVLTIVDKADSHSTYEDATLTLYIPKGTVFDDVRMTVGATKLTADTLSAKSLKLMLGAGDAKFEYLHVSSNVDIQGGAGQVDIVNGTLNNLTLEMGVGELNLTAALRGDSDLEFGMGTSNITLLGSKDDYGLDIEKGLGSITVDGQKVTDFGSSGRGSNHVEIEGGVGTVNLKFQEK